MNARAAAWLAWTLAAVSLLIMALGLLLIFIGWSTPLPKGWHPWTYQAIDAIGLIGAPVLGGLIASRQPQNPYGWLWIGFGMGFALVTFTYAYTAYALVVAPGSLPAPRTVSALLGTEGFIVAFILLPFLLLLFPDGRLPSGRWRFLAWGIIGLGAILVILGPLLSDSANHPFVNPIGVEGAVGEVIHVLAFGGIYVLFGAIALSALSLVLRYRRAAGVERQQIKWFAYAAVLFCGFLVLTYSLPDLLNSLLGSAALLGLHASVGIAILKYRLYDIDVLINRTLVYGSLTATLALVYFGGVATAQALFRALTGQEQQQQLAIMVSTLVIAALFNPLRRRVQSFIDRRFYLPQQVRCGEDSRSLLREAARRDRPGRIKRRPRRGSEGDDATGPRLFVAAPRYASEGRAGRVVYVLFTRLPRALILGKQKPDRLVRRGKWPARITVMR